MGNDKDVILTIIAGSAMIFLLILVIIIFVVHYSKKIVEKESAHQLSIKNKELELLRAVIETQESEREKIAANLHDEVGPLLSTLKLNISKHKRDLAKSNLTIEALDKEREFIDNIVDNIRTASHHLTPQFVLKYGLLKGLSNFVAPISTPVITIHSNLSSDVRLGKQITINMYRIALELINNALKHDKPDNMSIELMKEKRNLVFRLLHNSRGLTNEAYAEKLELASGLGLGSIQSRIIILNGKIDFQQTPNGSVTNLIIPLN